MKTDELLTRDEVLPFLARHGFKTTKGFFNRACAPGGLNSGPPVEAEAPGHGRKHLYHPDRLLAWARENLVTVSRITLREGSSQARRRRTRSSLHAAA